jgi:hypothetical protein
MHSSRAFRTIAGVALSLSTILVFVDRSVYGQESRRVVDLRNQLVPIAEEQVDAVRFSIVGRGDGTGVPFPVSLTLQSISPVSELTGRAIVELVVQNTSDRKFRLPVSREMKLLHADGNEDRRRLVCSMLLTHDGSETTIALGAITYSSSGDPSSSLELLPRESALFRFEASYTSPWELDRSKWKDGMNRGAVRSGVQCAQERFILSPEALRGERRYVSDLSDAVRSSNDQLLSLRP